MKIYEYEPGFVHAKSYLADGDTAMIGTINLLQRAIRSAVRVFASML